MTIKPGETSSREELYAAMCSASILPWGARYKERLVDAAEDHECRLAAVQWPERELVFDHGVNIPLADG